MALVKVRGQRRVLDHGGDVTAFLSDNGIRYQRWGTERMPRALTGTSLTDLEKERVLDLYRDEILSEKMSHGYVAADVVALAPDNPKLGEICAKFDKEHTHDDDEVRFVVSGHGTFTVRGHKDEAIDITLGAGDYIVLPKGRKHWFTLLPDRKIVAVRLFQDHGGWTPHYTGAGTGETEIPSVDLARAFGDLAPAA